MAEKKTKTCQSTENLSDSGKNECRKKSQTPNLMEKGDLKEPKNSTSKVNKDKSKNGTKEEKSCANEKTKEMRISPAKETKLDQSIHEPVIKEGYLTVHGKMALRKKSRLCYFRLLPASPSSRALLQQYSNEESVIQNRYQPELVIVANDVNSVFPVQEHAFVIQYREESLNLIAKDDFEQKTWIKAIQKALLSENQVTFTDVKIPRSFDVYISKETQLKIGDGSQVELLVEYGSIAVIASNNMRLVRWPIAKLRKFGFDAGTFMVTAGRNSECGEGVYSFITKQGEEIHRTVKAAKTKDTSFDVPPPGTGRQPCIPESSSPPSSYLGYPKYIPFEGTYDEMSMYHPIYEPVGSMNPNLQKFPGPKAPLASKARYPTDPGCASRPVEQCRTTSSLQDTASQRSHVKALPTASNDREAVYDDVRLHWVDHGYKNIVASETAFPIYPNKMVIHSEPPSAEEPIYADVDRSKKTNKKIDSGISLVPEHKRVTPPHDAKGYTIPGNNKFWNHETK